jgi:hypothetical protein
MPRPPSPSTPSPGKYIVSPFPGREHTNQPDPAAGNRRDQGRRNHEVEVTK